MTGGPPVFNCGEYKPLRFNPIRPPIIQEPNIFIPVSLNPRPPRRTDPVENYVCICRSTVTTLGGCSDESSRECVKISEAGGFPQSEVQYSSREQCEADAYSKRPCALSLFQCTRTQEPCPPPQYGTISRGFCGELPPVAFRPAALPIDIYDTLGNCILNCRTIRDCVSIPTTGDGQVTPAIPGGPPTGYKCVTTFSQCQNSGLRRNIRECVECVIKPEDPNCINQTLSECETACVSDECKYECVPYQIECPDNTYATGTRCAPCIYNPLDQSTENCNLPDESSCSECVPPICPPVIAGRTRIPVIPIIRDPGVLLGDQWRCAPGPACIRCTTQEILAGYCPYTTEARCIADCGVINTGGIYNDPVRYKCVNSTCTLCAATEAATNPNLCRYSNPNCNGECVPPPVFITYKGIIENGVRQCVQCNSTTTNPNTCPYPTLRDCALAWLYNPSTFDAETTFKASIQITQNNNINIINLGLNDSNVIEEKSFSEENKDTNIYDPIYNFFNYTSNETTRYVTNIYYLNIFNDFVAEEVYAFLDKNFKQQPFWNEKLFSNLTLAKISISLRKELIDSFSNIRSVDGTLVDPINFYQMIRKLLITNKLNEFDPSFYINLYEQQKDELINQYQFSESSEILERASLGILKTGSLISDPSQYKDLDKFKILRQKRLNTDINTRVNVTDINNQDYSVSLADDGLQVTDQDASSLVSVPLGTGEGYFINVTTDEEIKLPLITEEYRSYFAPTNIRYAALKAFQQNPDINLYVSSLSGQHELIESYELSTVLTPMYFALNLSKIEDQEKINPLVDNIKAEFNLLTNNQEIQDHVYNYGYSVIRINLDYRDPLIHYAKDTSCLSLEQNDITFRFFDLVKSGTLNSNSILTRNLPFGIVLVPGCGSQHNPFAGGSEIVDRFNGKVIRKITLTTLYDPSSKNIINEPKVLSSIETEPIESNLPEQNYNYANRFYYVYSTEKYKDTYFYNGIYKSTEPQELSKDKPVTSFMVNEVIDKLIQGYSPKELKWFDVYSRLTANQMGDLEYNNSYELEKSLEEGERGVLIKPVLRTDKEVKTYIDPLIIPEVDVPNPIITKENRFNAI
jgi:hypothetical protein